MTRSRTLHSMNTLTRAELLACPGALPAATPVEPETSPGSPSPRRARSIGPSARPLSRAELEHRPSFLGRALDVRRFTGKDRIDRVASYLRAHLPRTATWAEDELRAYAARLVQTAQIVE